MSIEPKSKRIIFLDVMRAIAVLMMVQGHTVHTFLAADLRSPDLLFYTIWHELRGFTAPIFMFTAGVVFTYLLFLNSTTHNKQRVIKGLKRFALLLGLGYLLRYPTWKIFDFSEVTYEQWQTFFVVDALHLIGFGLLFVIILSLLAEKVKISPYITLFTGAIFFVFISPVIDKIDWGNIFPDPIAAYFYYKTGSIFPLFPWIGYVLGGAILGLFLAHNPLIYKKKRFGSGLIAIGLSSMFVYLAATELVYFFEGNYLDSGLTVGFFFLRIGFVITLNGIVALIVIKVNSIPNIIKLIGRHTLLIYVVHLVILYGSAWIPGVYTTYAQTLNTPLTILAVFVMYALMISMILGLDKFQKYWKLRKTA